MLRSSGLVKALVVAVMFTGTAGCLSQTTRVQHTDTVVPPASVSLPSAPAPDAAPPVANVEPAPVTVGPPPENTPLAEEKTGGSSVPYIDLWDRIRAGYALPVATHPRYAAEIDWYRNHQNYLDRFVQRATPYLFHIVEEVGIRGLPAEIALLPVVESAFQPFAYSHGRASGIWQFIPSTGRLYGLRQNWWYDGRRDVVASTRAALDYLQKLQREFDGDWLLALAAYNSGEGTVNKAIKRNRRRGRPTDFWSLSLPRETRGYVPRLLAIAAVVRNPEQYGVTLGTIPDAPYFRKIDTGGQIDLALAAELANISLEEIYRLNPAFNRWATDPDGNHELLLPVDRADAFVTKLAALPVEQRVRWLRHRIRRGETLSHIAKRYHTTVRVLRRVNRLRGNRIRAGRGLIVPVASKRLTRYALSAGQRKQSIQHTPRSGRKIVHTVARGDTLWDIARYYGVGVRRLASWNGMATRDVLRPGQRLVVWTRDKPQTRTALSRQDAPPQRSVMRAIRYVVRKGDSLARIASRFRVTVVQLRRWNELQQNRYLQPGQRLRLFVDVTRQ